MARRAGKAASRRARQQRRAQRPMSPPPAAAPPPAEGRRRRGGRRRVARGAAARIGPGRSAPSPVRAYAGGGSSLTDRERAEYHYVERDLRNIGILTAILFALLIAAWFVVSAIRGFG